MVNIPSQLPCQDHTFGKMASPTLDSLMLPLFKPRKEKTPVFPFVERIFTGPATSDMTMKDGCLGYVFGRKD